MIGATASTLLVVSHDTLEHGLAELLWLAETRVLADTIDAGMVVVRGTDDRVEDCFPDFDVAPGVVITEQAAETIDPWAEDLRPLLEAVHQLTTGDVVATREGVYAL